ANNEKFHDTDGDTNYWMTDPVYRDLDNNSTVSEGDIRLTEFVAWDGSYQVHYTAGSIVRNCERDIGLALSTFQSAVLRYRHIENGIPNNTFEPGEMIVRDADGSNSITAGDTRFSYYGVISANVSIMNDSYSDYGKTLTKGWTDISGEVLVNYADGGEQILKLAHYPVIAPVIPQDNDVNYRVMPIQLKSNPTNFKNTGKWYYIVTAVSDTLNEESPPWPERIVDFATGNMNAVHLTWSPVPNASKYKVYRTKDAGTYGEDSLVAVVKAPNTSYIDVGCDALTGTPRSEYRSSFTKIIIERPTTGGSYVTRQMNEYELSDYKIDCKTGLITFRKSLKQLDTVVADYDIAQQIMNEKVTIDTISGRGQFRHGEIIDPDLFGEEEYKLELRKVSASNPNYPTVLVRGVDYQFMDANNNVVEGLKKGSIVFYTQISDGDSVYADYFYREKIRGDLVAVANGNETQLRTHQSNIVPGTYTVYKGKTLSSAPVINVMNSERGPLVTFTTPVNVVPEASYQVNPTPESKRDITIVFSLQTGIRNPSKAGNYQLYVKTSQEQTEILSTPYVIEAGNESQQLIKLTQDQSVSSGQTIALTCAVQDSLGNMIPNTPIKYSIVSSPNSEGVLNKEDFVTDSSGNAVAMYTTSKTPGLNTIKAHIVGTTQSVTFKINGLSSQPITRIEISPKDVRVLPNGTQNFTAIGYNSAGENVPNIKFTWSVNPTSIGTISSDGTFTAGSSNAAGTVIAEAYGVRASTNITIASGQTKVSYIVINPSQAEVSVGNAVQFIAKAFDDKGAEVSVPFSWTISNTEFATINDRGLLTALKAGTVIVIATEPGGMNQYATVTITQGEPGISYIEIQPSTYQLNVGQSVQFTVSAYDQAGDRFTPNNIIWEVSGNIGILNNSGVFTATNVGIGRVTAKVGTLSATAEVTVHSSQEEDKVGPVITIISPKDGDTVSENTVLVRGTAVDPSGVKQVLVNNVPANLNADGTFTSQPVAITSGSNVISIIATDNRNNISMLSITVKKTVPVIIKLQIGNKNAVIMKNNMPQFVTIDLAPFTTEGRTMVPLRFITESFGALVDWKPDVPATGEGQITITLDKSNGSRVQLIMHTGSTFMKKVTTKDGNSSEEAINYSPAPYIVKPQNRTVVPLRFISEQFGATVDWDSTTQEITITYYP
ncbi:MAG: stalk domain-containing protein, partial [Caldisericia bacterium]|nr:stalk domain-containing protein [Caldisericia bacterium]